MSDSESEPKNLNLDDLTGMVDDAVNAGTDVVADIGEQDANACLVVASISLTQSNDGRSVFAYKVQDIISECSSHRIRLISTAMKETVKTAISSFISGWNADTDSEEDSE